MSGEDEELGLLPEAESNALLERARERAREWRRLHELGKPPAPALTAADFERRREADAQAHERVRAQALTPAAIAAWQRHAGVGRRHAELAIDPQLVPAALRRWSQPDPHGGSAILSGRTGAGKTTAGVWAMRQLYRAGRPELCPPRWECASALYSPAPELFAAVFAKAPLTRYERAQLLVLDDWGAAHETDWPLAAMDALIDRRWRERCSTILTTNLTPEELQKRYPRIFDRLRDGGPGVVEFNRGSLRRAAAAPGRPDRGRGRPGTAPLTEGERP